MNIEHALKELGLKNNAIQTYIACMELGSGTVLRISKRAGLPRSTCDVVLSHLQERGFVSSFRKKRVRHFSAHDPRKIISFLKEKIHAVEHILPHLLALYGTAETQPTVRSYKGREGIRLVLHEVLDDTPRELLSFTWADDLFSLLPEDFPAFVKKRHLAHISVKVITYESAFAKQRQQLGPRELREIRFIPKLVEFHAMLMIWNKKIAFFSLDKELSVFVIESSELAHLQKTMFLSLWEHLSPLSLAKMPYRDSITDI